MRQIALIVAIVGLWGPEPAGAASPGAPVEERMKALESEVGQRIAAGEIAAADAVLEEMSRLDSRHPQLYVAATKFADGESRVRRLGKDGPGLAYGLALLDWHDQRDKQGLERAGEAVRAYEAVGHLAGQAASHNLRGMFLKKKKRYEEAEAALRSALSLLEKIDDPVSAADVLSNLGMVMLANGDPGANLDIQRQVLEIRERFGDLTGQGRSWITIGRSLFDLGRHAEAIDAAEAALAIREGLGDRPGQFSAIREKARALDAGGAHDDAIATYERAFARVADLESTAYLARTHYDVGRIYLATGRCLEAAERLEPAAELFSGRGWVRSESGAWLLAGRARLRRSEFARAGDHLRRAVESARASGQLENEAHALTDLAQVFLATGELAQALLDQDRARELFRSLESRRDEMVGVNNLGAIYYRLGDLTTAEYLLRDALGIALELGDALEIARARAALGVVLIDLGRAAEALGELRASIEIRDEAGEIRGASFSRFNAAEACWQLGRHDEARELVALSLNGFLAIGNRDGQAFALNLDGRFRLDSGDLETSMERFGRAQAIAREYGLPRHEWMARYGIGRVLELEGRYEDAIGAYSLALDIVERLRGHAETIAFRMRFLDSKIDLYERIIDLRARMEEPSGIPAEAFRLAERAHARGWLELLTESRSALRAHAPANLVNEERQLLDRISILAADVIEASTESERQAARYRLMQTEQLLRRLEIEIRRSVPGIEWVSRPDVPSLKHLGERVLQRGETLLAYFIGPSRSMLWVIGGDGHLGFHRLPPSDEIAELTDRWRERAGRAGVHSPTAANRAARALTDAILPASLPIERRLIVAPDGPLHHVPFGALVRDGRYLIQDHEIVVAPSAASLELMRNAAAPSAGRGFLGAGEPTVADDDPRFEPLPYSGRAVRAIADAFPEDQRKLLVGEAFTRSALQEAGLEHYRYLHLATHGWLDSELPRHSGLILSSDSTEATELLHLHDVLSMRLAADLVVLSSCRSGQGEFLRGEGMVGLTRAFLLAGARSLVVSLWDVNDRSTAEFMEAFYARLHEGASIPAALRQTKLKFIESDRAAQRQPYRWAPFVQIGAPMFEPDRSSID